MRSSHTIANASAIRRSFFVGATFVGAILATADAAASAQSPGVPPSGQMGMPGMSGALGTKVPQTELTEKSAKSAIDSYLAVKEKYGDETPSVNPQQSSLAALEQLDGLDSIIKSHGFKDTGEWHTAVVSVAMAYGFTRDGTRAQVDESIASIKDNPNLPADLVQQLLGVIQDMQPSDNNVAVVQGLLADPEYKTKLEQIGK